MIFIIRFEELLREISGRNGPNYEFVVGAIHHWHVVNLQAPQGLRMKAGYNNRKARNF